MPRLKKEIHKDFTVVHNAFVRDENLGINARGLLITMLSMPEYTKNGEPWNFSIRGLASMLPDGKQRVQTALNELERCGYLLRRQIIDSKGRFVDLEYVFSDEIMPEAIEAYQDKQKSKCNDNGSHKSEENDNFFVSPNPENPCPQKQDTENQDSEKPNPKKSDNNKINNNQITNNQICSDKSLYQSISAPVEKSEMNTEKSKKTDGQIDGLIDKSQKAKKYSQEMRNTIDFIKYLIDYDNYVYGYRDQYIPTEELDEHIESIARTICNDQATITICGQEFPHEVVKSVLLKVNIECLERAVESMKKTDIIRNHEKYFLSTLFNEINNNHFKTNHEERWSDYVIRRDFGYQP